MGHGPQNASRAMACWRLVPACFAVLPAQCSIGCWSVGVWPGGFMLGWRIRSMNWWRRLGSTSS
eukprot:4396355-Amphidinium_carterae.1